MDYIAHDLVSELLAWDNGNLLAHMLVDMEVIAQVPVVLLKDDPDLLLCGLGAHAAPVITIENKI